ncbi:nucleoplasmin-2a isoform X1 [Danio rerio]|uniref:Nucleoplasmin-2a isoform X1 n=1 Tax=Danio rerio TaxID=7955 RepID=A0AC58G8F5_DANRE
MKTTRQLHLACLNYPPHHLCQTEPVFTGICLSEDAGDEMHIVAVCDGVGASKPLPIATLRHCMPMISFPGLELIPPVTFKLCSGKGPVFVSAQHITLNPIEMIEEEEEEKQDEEEDEDG